MSDIAAISSLTQQAQAQQQVQYAVARKVLDNAEAQGDAAIALLQTAANIQKNAPTSRPLAPGQTISLVG